MAFFYCLLPLIIFTSPCSYAKNFPENSQLITFNEISHLDEIQLKTFFLDVVNSPKIENAIKKTFLDLGFSKIPGELAYEKKHPNCALILELEPSECLIKSNIYYFSSEDFTVFDISFTVNNKNVTTKNLYTSYINQLTINLFNQASRY